MISTKDAAKLLNNISDRRVRVLCAENRIKGAKLVSGVWMVPNNPKVLPPKSGRVRAGKIKQETK